MAHVRPKHVAMTSNVQYIVNDILKYITHTFSALNIL
jgi:hypothetical protein